MESISELRGICQATRPSIYGDFLSQFYYRVSIYLTWMCLALGMSANQVTILSGVVAGIGGALLATRHEGLILAGSLCFHIFSILDMSDGEVARYRNESSITGFFLDWYMHFVWVACLYVGLTFGALTTVPNGRWDLFMTLLGFLGLVTVVLDKSIVSSGWTVVSWTRLRVMMTGKEIFDESEEINVDEASGSAENREALNEDSPKEGPTKYRLKRAWVLPTLIFQDRWASMALVVLASLQLVLDHTPLACFDFRPLWIAYAGIIGPFYIASKVRGLVKKRAFEDGYRRLYANRNPIKLPEDDFF